MKKIKFTKMSASGNDFVVIDNRKKQISEVSSQMPEFVRKVCQRKMGIGADGVLLIECVATERDASPFGRNQKSKIKNQK